MEMARSILLCALLFIITRCASIVSSTSWPFAIDTHPEGAEVRITNRRGEEIFRSKTPTVVRLKSGAGFFIKESYVVTLSMNGYDTKKINVECKLNGWYFGNAFIGGLIGFLIVDPATGAMYRLASTGITENMTKQYSTGVTLNILDKNNVPKDWERNLEKIN
ncbi:hypothetical protein [Flavisolibacter tropicus]|uniref:PEGA domain-containing protein n=1 Tax=Flavisolibacter tropicus TaxID=1492898 RepID=A0A172TYM2_9BACT|nr:hypothetical protein [Flavisolibacter tropicus]ANE52175.1 hypothetical protein SY85_18420 [Flavisolibacter tropicus]